MKDNAEKRTSKYEGNKKIMEDEIAYPDYNTVLLIDLLAELVVDTTLMTARSVYDISSPSPLPDLDATP